MKSRSNFISYSCRNREDSKGFKNAAQRSHLILAGLFGLYMLLPLICIVPSHLRIISVYLPLATTFIHLLYLAFAFSVGLKSETVTSSGQNRKSKEEMNARLRVGKWKILF